MPQFKLFQIQILNAAEYKSAVILQSQKKHVTVAERETFMIETIVL